MDERADVLRVAVMEQAIEIGLPRLALAADTAVTRSVVFEAAVADVMAALGLDEDQARFAVVAGVAAGALLHALD